MFPVMDYTSSTHEGLRIFEAIEQFLEADALLRADVEPLVASHEAPGYLLLTVVEEGGFLYTVRQKVPCDERECARRQTFNEEQNSPGRDRSPDLRDSVC